MSSGARPSALIRTGSEYRPVQTDFRRRKSAMTSGLIQTRIRHRGQLSKRRQDDCTAALQDPDRRVLSPCQPPRRPVEGDILTDPGSPVVAPGAFEDLLSTELRRAMDHRRQATDDTTHTQVRR